VDKVKDIVYQGLKYKGKKSLSQDVATLVAPLLQHTFSVRCSRSAGGREDVFSVFFADSVIVSHDRSRAIVSVLERLPVPAAAVAPCVAFFGLEASPVPDDGLAAELPADLVDEIHRGRADLSAAEIAAQLGVHGLPDDAAAELANDFLVHDYRGSAIRIDIQGDQAVSERGCLILKSGGRAWCFDILPGTPATLRLYRGTPGRLAETVSALVASS
nr:hypothetical protein [Ardenticatenia bacterium]